MSTPSIPEPTRIYGHTRALIASKYAAEIGALLYRYCQEVDGICPGVAWNDLPWMHTRVYRGLGEKAVMSLDILAVDRAKSRMQDWCKAKLEQEFEGQFNVFPRDLVEAALEMAPSELDHQLRRGFDEMAGVAREARLTGKCGYCGGLLWTPEAFTGVALCENCGREVKGGGR